MGTCNINDLEIRPTAQTCPDFRAWNAGTSDDDAVHSHNTGCDNSAHGLRSQRNVVKRLVGADWHPVKRSNFRTAEAIIN